MNIGNGADNTKGKKMAKRDTYKFEFTYITDAIENVLESKQTISHFAPIYEAQDAAMAHLNSVMPEGSTLKGMKISGPELKINFKFDKNGRPSVTR